MTLQYYDPALLPGRDDISKIGYANGSTLLFRANPASPAVVFRGYLPGGSICNPPEKAGLAGFTARMLLMGTQGKSFKKLHDKIETIGASLGLGAGSLSLTFGGQCLRDDLPIFLDLLLEVLTQPTFPRAQLDRLKAQTLATIDMQSQDTGEMASQAFDRLFYRDHPYSIPDLGTLQSVSSINRSDCRQFLNKHISPNGLVMAVSGGVEFGFVRSAFETTFARWEKQSQPQPELPPFTAPTTEAREHVTLEEKSQTDLIIGTLAPKAFSEDYYPVLLGNSILGQFGMMGRIGESVRERAGLAYYAQTNLASGLGPVPWQVIAGVNPNNLQKASDLIRLELRRFTSEPVSEEELLEVRSQAIGRLPLSVESNAGITQHLLSIERYQLDPDHLRKLPDTLKQVTAEKILEAARNYWNLDSLIITSAGRAL